MQVLLSLSIALLAGLLLSRLAKAMKLPAVTAYLVAGILVGPFLLGRLSLFGVHFGFVEEDLSAFKIMSEVALGFIAFSIGNEFRLSDLKKNGKAATVIGIFQAVVATVLVDAVLIVIAITTKIISIEAAIVLGAIASATAPAATLMVVKQYKAKGPVTEMLLPVVALDDAVGLVIFAISFGIADAIKFGNINVNSIIIAPIIEIALSRIPFEIFGVEAGFSPLLTAMMLGTVFCNFCDFSEEIMGRVDKWTAPLFVLFFVLSATELKLTVFGDLLMVLVGVVYIIFRCAGKYLGSYVSAKASGCDDKIVKYLGITLFPQAGVALGMARDAKAFGEIGDMVFTITLFAVLIYELFGPVLTKIALLKAGDINPEARTSAREVHVENMPEHKKQRHFHREAIKTEIKKLIKATKFNNHDK